MFFMRLHSEGNVVNGVFWGLWLFPFGFLVYKSGFIPRFLGIWLVIEGFAYCAFSLVSILARTTATPRFSSGSRRSSRRSRSCCSC